MKVPFSTWSDSGGNAGGQGGNSNSVGDMTSIRQSRE